LRSDGVLTPKMFPNHRVANVKGGFCFARIVGSNLDSTTVHSYQIVPEVRLFRKFINIEI
jgi:hypothetical protein